MANLLKRMVGVVSKNLKTFVVNVGKELKKESIPSGLITAESNPELIKAVTEELRATDAHLIISKLQDIEKAIYHLAGRQQQSFEKQVELEQVVVAMHTTLEEMLHGMEVMSDESDEEVLDNAWEGKKTVSLN